MPGIIPLPKFIQRCLSVGFLAGVTAIADAPESTPGTYVASFNFSMPGDWVLLVSAALPDGERVEERIDVARVR